MPKKWESYVNNYAVSCEPIRVWAKFQIKAVLIQSYEETENYSLVDYIMTCRYLTMVMGLQRGITNAFYGCIIKIRSSTEIYSNETNNETNNSSLYIINWKQMSLKSRVSTKLKNEIQYSPAIFNSFWCKLRNKNATLLLSKKYLKSKKWKLPSKRYIFFRTFRILGG